MNRLIEALMYIKGEEGLTPKEIKKVKDISTQEARNLLKSFKNNYNEDSEKALFVIQFNDCFKFATKEEFKEDIIKLVIIEKKQKLSQAAIETAGIIAYKQPITRSEINNIRGVSSEMVVNTLLVKGLIEERGTANSLGNPILFGITNKFYDYFNINSLKELPELKEFEEINNEEKTQEENFDLFQSQRE